MTAKGQGQVSASTISSGVPPGRCPLSGQDTRPPVVLLSSGVLAFFPHWLHDPLRRLCSHDARSLDRGCGLPATPHRGSGKSPGPRGSHPCLTCPTTSLVPFSSSGVCDSGRPVSVIQKAQRGFQPVEALVGKRWLGSVGWEGLEQGGNNLNPDVKSKLRSTASAKLCNFEQVKWPFCASVSPSVGRQTR